MTRAFYRLADIVNTPARGTRAARGGFANVSRSTWLRWVADGLAPKPVKIGRGVVAWRAEDIESWRQSCAAGGGGK